MMWPFGGGSGGRENGQGPAQQEKEKVSITYIDIMRHANRFGGKWEEFDEKSKEMVRVDDPEDLVPIGVTNAEQYGASNFSDFDNVATTASMEVRAAQTGDAVTRGAGKDLGLMVNKKAGTYSNQATGFNYKELGPEQQSMIKKVRPMINKKALALAWENYNQRYDKLTPEQRSEIRHMAQEVGLKEAMKNESFIEEAAEGIAYNVWALHQIEKGAHDDVGLKPGLKTEGKKTALPLVNHSVFTESFLIKALKVTDGGQPVRLQSADDLGGFLKPGESFRIKITRRGNKEEQELEFTNPERQKLFKGKKMEIDWAVVEDLYKKYEGRLAGREGRISREAASVKQVAFMGDTQLGGDKEQTERMRATQALVEKMTAEGKMDEVWSIGDLGTSKAAYDFLNAYKKLDKSGKEKKGNGLDFKEELQVALAAAFDAEVKAGKAKAAKYLMRPVLNGKDADYPPVAKVVKDFTERIVKDSKFAEFKKYVVGEGDKAKLDLFRIFTGRDTDFKSADAQDMVNEMKDELNTLIKMTKEGGPVKVVPGNQETTNWERVTKEVMPEFQKSVDLQRNPTYHEVDKNVAIFGMPYEFDKDYKFDAAALAKQAEGKKTVVIAMHASPLFGGLKEIIGEPMSGAKIKEKIVTNLKLAEADLKSPFEKLAPEKQENLLKRTGGSKKEEFTGKSVGEALDVIAKKYEDRGKSAYERVNVLDAERKKRIEKHGAPDRTPRTQSNPLHDEFLKLIKNLPASVERVIVPWGHLHSTPEKALADFPQYKFDDGEIKAQKMKLNWGPGKAQTREIDTVYLPTAAVAVFKFDEFGNAQVGSLPGTAPYKPAEKAEAKK